MRANSGPAVKYHYAISTLVRRSDDAVDNVKCIDGIGVQTL